MTNNCLLSDNTVRYLNRYQMILNDMIGQMTAAAVTDSISGSFIVQMIPHHEVAIKMSENLLLYTTDIPLQNIAKNIISAQQKSIANMVNAYPKCGDRYNTPQERTSYEAKNNCILTNMFYGMSTAFADNCIDADFIREMIPHHEGAVQMSENALRYPLCPELVSILDAIITEQKRGIQELRYLLKQGAVAKVE